MGFCALPIPVLAKNKLTMFAKIGYKMLVYLYFVISITGNVQNMELVHILYISFTCAYFL